MADTQSPSKLGLTRGKAILIAVLAVVLLAVLYIQLGGGEKPVAAPSTYKPPRPALAIQPAGATTKPVALAATTTLNHGSLSKDLDKNASAAAAINPGNWQSPKLDKLVAYDPFALPPAFPQTVRGVVDKKGVGKEDLIAAAAADEAKRMEEAALKLRLEIEELQQRGVHMVFRDGDQYAAVIGEHFVHVGDQIDGFTVTAIDPDSINPVHIEKKDSP